MLQFSLRWQITAQDGGKIIKDFLKEQKVSKASLTDIKYNGGSILVNGQEVTVRYPLKFGDELVCQFPVEVVSEGMQGENIPLEIIYEDDYLLVVNKPARMSTIPSREHPKGSLANALIGYYNQINVQSTAHIVTRLDRDTSGLVLIAKHRHIHHLLSEQQKSGNIKRVYEAFAEGPLQSKRGIIDKPIGRKNESIIEREVRHDGQMAITHYSVIQTFIHYAWLELQLETGRTHQIRVHLSSIGHPLLGDDLYGGSMKWIKRQALHCRRISFIHPFHRKQLDFEVELPSDMKELKY